MGSTPDASRSVWRKPLFWVLLVVILLVVLPYLASQSLQPG
jgi:hypothetical protein